jgi:hypothetical protein
MKGIPSPLMGEGKGGGDLGDYFTASGRLGGLEINSFTISGGPNESGNTEDCFQFLA